jgi:hypothetical protein
VPLAEGETWHGKSLLPTQACEEAAGGGFAWWQRRSAS